MAAACSTELVFKSQIYVEREERRKVKRTKNQNEEGMEKCEEKRDGAIEQREETETKERKCG